MVENLLLLCCFATTIATCSIVNDTKNNNTSIARDQSKSAPIAGLVVFIMIVAFTVCVLFKWIWTLRSNDITNVRPSRHKLHKVVLESLKGQTALVESQVQIPQADIERSETVQTILVRALCGPSVKKFVTKIFLYQCVVHSLNNH